MSLNQDPIPLQDLKAQYAAIRSEVESAIARVMAAQEFILGSEVAAFENELGAWLGDTRVIGVGSGSDALLLALMALNVKAGDEVILPAYTFFATAGAVVRLGAKPVFVDVCRSSLCLDADQVASYFEQTHPVLNASARFHHVPGKARVILPVHLFGIGADLEPLLHLAKARDGAVVEDAAQALGATSGGRQVGTVGKVNCLSFFPSKNLGAAGDGGAVVTSDDGIAERIRSLRVHGSRPKYHHREVGMNSRLDALQAAILRVKLKYLNGWNRQRSDAADRYDGLFERAGLSDRVTMPWRRPGDRHVFHQYVIRLAERDRVLATLSDQKIGCAVYYPIPMHLQPCFKDLGYRAGDCPVSEEAARTSLALPLYPEITEEQQARVVAAIARCLS